MESDQRLRVYQRDAPGPDERFCRRIRPADDVFGTHKGKHAANGASKGGLEFQSAPGPMARGNITALPGSEEKIKFQSAPGPMARGNPDHSACQPSLKGVSIRPRPDGQGKRIGHDAVLDAGEVSIRPRPDGQGKHHGFTGQRSRRCKFQSAPGPMARGNDRGRRLRRGPD